MIDFVVYLVEIAGSPHPHWRRDKVLFDRTSRWLLIIAVVAIAALTLVMGPRVRSIVANSLWLAAAVTVIALPIGTLVATILAKTTAGWARCWLSALLPMIFLPLYLHVAGWQAALGVGGWLNPPQSGNPGATVLSGWTGAVFIHAVAAVPMVVLVMIVGLRRTDAAAEEAAALSSSPARVLWHVTLPQVRPAMVAAVMWVTVVCVGEITVTDFFGIRTFGEEIYTAREMGGFPIDGPRIRSTSSTMLQWSGVVVGTLVMSAVVGMGLIAGASALTGSGDQDRKSWKWRLSATQTGLAHMVVLAVWLVVAGLPLVSLVIEAGRTARWLDGEPVLLWSVAKLGEMIRDACWLHRREMVASLALAGSVAAMSTIVAIVVAWTARCQPRWRWIFFALVAVTLALPGPAVGIATHKLFSPSPESPLLFLDELHQRTWVGPWFAQCLRIAPIVVLIALAGMWQIPQSTIDAARTDGAGWASALVRVALPSQWHTVANSLVVSFMLSLGELSATLTPTPAGIPPLAVRLFSLLHYGAQGRVAAMALVVLIAAWVASLAVMLLATRDAKD